MLSKVIGELSCRNNNPTVRLERLTDEQIEYWTNLNKNKQSSSHAKAPILDGIKQVRGTSENIQHSVDFPQNTEQSFSQEEINTNIKIEPVNPIPIKEERPDTHEYNSDVSDMGFDDQEKKIPFSTEKDPSFIRTKLKPFKCTECVYGTKSLDKFLRHTTDYHNKSDIKN